MAETSYVRLLPLTGLALAFALASGSAVAKQRVAPADYWPPAEPKVGGPTCETATDIQLPDAMTLFSDMDTTCGAPAVVSAYNNATCPTFAYPGPELIYQITLTGDMADVSFTMTPTAPADMGLFMVSTCGVGSTCLRFSDFEGPGEAANIITTPDFRNPMVQFPDQVTAGTYYLYVDSFFATGPESCGQYTLEAQGSVPVELIDFSID